MNIKGFKAKNGTVHQYDYDALANKPAIPEGPGSGGNVDLEGYATEQWVRDQKYLTEVPDGYAKTDDIPTKPEDIGALPNTYTPPDQTAEQVGADPVGTAASAVSQHNIANDSHGDIRLELKAINDKLNAFFDSDNQTLDELSEIVAYITSNKTLIDGITINKVNVADIIDNLTTNVANKPLSAAQGVVLKGLIDALSRNLANYQPKGDYALRSELPTVPTKVSAFENDKRYLTEHQDISGKLDANKLPEAIDTALAQAKASGEFDGEDGSDGFATFTESEYAEITEAELAAKYADGVRALVITADENLIPTAVNKTGAIFNGCGYLDGHRLNSSGDVIESERSVVTGYIPYEHGHTIEIAGATNPVSTGGQYIATYDADFNLILVNYMASLVGDSGGSDTCTDDNNHIYTVNTAAFSNANNTNGFKNAKYIRVALNPFVGHKMRVRYI